jgi:uncharacterized membrane-anchored protein YhcB (DUF1043 family)
MSRLTGLIFGLIFAILVVNRFHQNSVVDKLNDHTAELDVKEEEIASHLASLKEQAVMIADLKENQKYLEIDVANLKITRTSTIEEVDKLIKDAIILDNVKEDEYNSLVAETMINMEENMRLIGYLNEVRDEIIKMKIIKELKKE